MKKPRIPIFLNGFACHLFLLLILLGSTSASAQLDIICGKGKLNMRKVHPNWYLDTLRHEATEVIYGPCGAFLDKLPDTVYSITQFNNVAILKSSKYYLFYDRNKLLVKAGIGYIKQDTLLWIWDKHAVDAIGPTTRNPLRLPDRGSNLEYFNCLDYSQINCLPHQVQGMHAFCLPWIGVADDTPRIYEELEELHSWGMLGVNGQWLIEPRFDAPFRFQDSIADVLYYGQKRKINEKGEFVD